MNEDTAVMSRHKSEKEQLKGKIGAVFLGYDSFLQNEIKSIIDYLIENDFVIFGSQVRSRLERNEAEKIFLADNIHVNEKFNWWMVNDLITAGPMACLFVYSPNDSDCLLKLNHLKGFGDPYLNNRETIRGKFKSINVAMNLIHVPDNYKELSKDVSPFLSINEIENLVKVKLEQNSINKFERNLLTKIEKFELDFYSNNLNKDYSFIKSLYFLKYEILKNLDFEDESKLVLMEVCIDLLNALNESRFKNLSKMRDTNSNELPLVHSMISLLKEKIHSCNDLGTIKKLSHDLKMMCLYVDLSLESNFIGVIEKDIDFLIASGVYLPSMHKHILLTSLSQWKEYSLK